MIGKDEGKGGEKGGFLKNKKKNLLLTQTRNQRRHWKFPLGKRRQFPRRDSLLLFFSAETWYLLLRVLLKCLGALKKTNEKKKKCLILVNRILNGVCTFVGRKKTWRFAERQSLFFFPFFIYSYCLKFLQEFSFYFPKSTLFFLLNLSDRKVEIVKKKVFIP